MKAGRKPIHKFNTIEVGERAELTGLAAKWPYQYTANSKKKFKILRKNSKVFAFRIS